MAKKDNQKMNTDNERIREKNDEELDNITNIEEETPNKKAISVLITVLIVLIWLFIFGVLIKLDVGGFGSKILSPVLKDVPVINKVLPDSSKSSKSDDVPYKSLAEAASYIKELEQEVASYQQFEKDKDLQITDLQAEVDRLKTFETNQQEFEDEKAKFYQEVVFGDKAIDPSNYIEYYKTIDKANADLLYQQAIEKYAYDEQVKEKAEYYSSMKPAKAAQIFVEMTGDLDIITSLLSCMDAKESGAIISAIGDLDPVFAAKITKKLMP